MWDHQCTADRKRDGRCARPSTIATWCFAFAGERFANPTWVETCTQHAANATAIVSMMAIRPAVHHA